MQVYDPSGFRDSVIEGLEQSKDEEDVGERDEIIHFKGIAFVVSFEMSCIYNTNVDFSTFYFLQY